MFTSDSNFKTPTDEFPCLPSLRHKVTLTHKLQLLQDLLLERVDHGWIPGAHQATYVTFLLRGVPTHGKVLRTSWSLRSLPSQPTL